MQQQISSFLATNRGLEQKLNEERLAKATSLSQLEFLHQTNERTLQLTATKLQSSNERLLAQLSEHKQVYCAQRKKKSCARDHTFVCLFVCFCILLFSCNRHFAT